MKSQYSVLIPGWSISSVKTSNTLTQDSISKGFTLSQGARGVGVGKACFLYTSDSVALDSDSKQVYLKISVIYLTSYLLLKRLILERWKHSRRLQGLDLKSITRVNNGARDRGGKKQARIDGKQAAMWTCAWMWNVWTC